MKYRNIAILSLVLSSSVMSEEIKLESLDFLKEESAPSKAVGSSKTIDLDINLDNVKKEFEALNQNNASVERKLREIITKIDPKLKNADIKKLKEIEDLYQVSNGKENIYIHKSGKYIIPLVAKVTGNSFEDLRVSKKKEAVARTLAQFPKEFLVSYKATNPRADIYVFSDYTCPYCNRFHENLLDLNNMGINVHYIPFPRNGVRDKKALNGLKNIMCSSEPSLEFNKAFEKRKTYYKTISPITYNCPEGTKALHNALILADKVKVRGTPYIYLSNGAYLGGWNGMRNFGALLEKELSKK